MCFKFGPIACGAHANFRTTPLILVICATITGGVVSDSPEFFIVQRITDLTSVYELATAGSRSCYVYWRPPERFKICVYASTLRDSYLGDTHTYDMFTETCRFTTRNAYPFYTHRPPGSSNTSQRRRFATFLLVNADAGEQKLSPKRNEQSMAGDQECQSATSVDYAVVRREEVYPVLTVWTTCIL